MNIIGEKVLLRAIEVDDCEMLITLINDPEIEYLLGGWSYPVSKYTQKKWFDELSQETNTLRLTIDANGQAIGTAILSNIDYKNGNAEIHIKLLQDKYGGKGYGTDAVYSLTRYAFQELRLHCIYAKVNMDNIISQKMFEKCGYMKEGIMRQRLFKRGKYVDIVMFSLMCDEIVL